MIMSKEYIDLVDEKNNPIGEKRLRSEVHTLGLWHRVVHAYVFREEAGKIHFLVHLRSKDKDVHSNQWDAHFGGHPKAGEDIKDALYNELREELGIKVDPSQLIQGETTKRKRFPDNKFATTYYYRFDGDTNSLKFRDGEVQAVEWMTENNLLDSLANNSSKWATQLVTFKADLESLKSVLG